MNYKTFYAMLTLVGACFGLHFFASRNSDDRYNSRRNELVNSFIKEGKDRESSERLAADILNTESRIKKRYKASFRDPSFKDLASSISSN